MMMSDIGEKGFLRHLLPSLKVDSAFINGFGHDHKTKDDGHQHREYKLLSLLLIFTHHASDSGKHRSIGKVSADKIKQE